MSIHSGKPAARPFGSRARERDTIFDGQSFTLAGLAYAKGYDGRRLMLMAPLGENVNEPGLCSDSYATPRTERDQKGARLRAPVLNWQLARPVRSSREG